MSHYTTLVAKFKDLYRLKLVCERLGLRVEMNAKARYYQGSVQADLAIKFTNYDVAVTHSGDEYYLGADSDIRYDLAFRQVLGDAEADGLKLDGQTEVEKFQDLLSQGYQRLVAEEVAFDHGYVLSSEEVEEDGTVVMRFSG